MKNINMTLARRYIDSFFGVLKVSINEKELKDMRKKVEKYEDVSYIKQLINDDITNEIISRYRNSRENNISRYQHMIEDINKFHEDNFVGKEIIDVPNIKKQLEDVQKQLENITSQEYLFDINPLLEFKNNISVELGTYVDKHKSDEYMDMSVFHNSVNNIITEVIAVLNHLIEDNKLDEKEYVSKYLEFVYSRYSLIFENSGNKVRNIPSWAKGLLFCAPWILGFGLFTLYPLIQTLIFSFSKVDLSTEGFVTTPYGFNNYIKVFTSDTDFILALKNYLVSMVVYVPLITIFSLILAMLLNTKIKSKGFFRTIFFFPVIITSGPVIKILMEQGVTAMSGVDTLFDMETITAKMPELLRIAFNMLTSEFIMILWFSGIQILVFVTGLQKIDKGVYEASAIDGANKWEQFWKVTLPAINPTIVINVVFTTVMQSIFALNPIILKIQADMNDTSEGKGYGYSSALAFTYFIIMITVLVIFVLIFKKKNKRSKEGR